MVIMAQKTVLANSDGGIIKVGTTGTIGSLMTKELESMKNASPTSKASQRKMQTNSVSVPCGTTPKKIQPRRNSSIECGSSSGSGNGNINLRDHGDMQKPRFTTPRNGHKGPMLGSKNVNIDKNVGRDKLGKKGSSHLVEVVDMKCNNPMSSRLKKLGFSKLSESVI